MRNFVTSTGAKPFECDADFGTHWKLEIRPVRQAQVNLLSAESRTDGKLYQRVARAAVVSVTEAKTTDGEEVGVNGLPATDPKSLDLALEGFSLLTEAIAIEAVTRGKLIEEALGNSQPAPV